ncbi:TMEM175 family protein [Streptomyces sp. NPDC006645]|uniref:TMEM175 family protein n=1 Tax=unclassified Streptomyces TaxID=2593676 RepID=UPI0033ACF8D1
MPTVTPERLLAFGDAVFAIAITLLALDIDVPNGLPEGRLSDALRDVMPDVGAYLLSFSVIGLLWLAHHRMFALVGRIDRLLLYLYFALLAVVAALPFPTRLVSEYGQTALATGVYGCVIGLASLLTTAMAYRLLRRPDLRKPGIAPARVRRTVHQGAVVVLVFVTSVPMTLVSPDAAKYWWALIIPLRLLLGWGTDPEQDGGRGHKGGEGGDRGSAGATGAAPPA